MTDKELLETLRVEDIAAALSRWGAGDDVTRTAVLRGRNVALEDGLPDAEILAGLRQAVEDAPNSIVEVASLIVRTLIAGDAAVFTLIDSLAASAKVQGRIGALLCLPPVTSDVLARPILSSLLGDRSKRVREMTVDWIRRNDLKQYLPILDAQVVSERDEALRAFMRREINLLREGYYVRRDVGSVYVTVNAMGQSQGGYVDPEVASKLSDRELAERFASMNR